MRYEQLSFPEEKPVRMVAWRAMGELPLQCPNCSQAPMYPGNTIMYAMVCACGWAALPLGGQDLVWISPDVTEEEVKKRFHNTNYQN